MYNFTTGPFAGNRHEMICAQSMNGRLFIIDHNKVLYQQVIPSNQFLLPGCLAYCAKTDCLITCNSSLLLMCYSMTSLANNSSDLLSEDSCSTIIVGNDLNGNSDDADNYTKPENNISNDK